MKFSNKVDNCRVEERENPKPPEAKRRRLISEQGRPQEIKTTEKSIYLSGSLRFFFCQFIAAKPGQIIK
jgi:hypothetical protein